MTEEYERLPEIVRIKGTGILGLTAKLVTREENKAMYYRCDDVYEVFRVKKAGEKTMFGKEYSKREVYPGNDDFGVSAWCFRDKKLAQKAYNAIPDTPIYIDRRVDGIDTEEGDTDTE
jgi:hypothetical protein